MKNDAIIKILTHGGIGVMPTDTIYGIVGSALNKKTVERTYKLRRRNPKKPMIILIGSMRDLAKFGVQLTVTEKKILYKIWPAKISVILPLKTKISKLIAKFRYLHRGTGAMAFRLPKPVWLRKLLLKTGPLAAPSANLEGSPPARTIKEARRYFGDKADFYLDKGRIQARPSMLIQIQKGKMVILRK